MSEPVESKIDTWMFALFNECVTVNGVEATNVTVELKAVGTSATNAIVPVASCKVCVLSAVAAEGTK